jgi:four helix bundle protein
VAIRSYRDLTVWQRAMDLTTESYRIAKLLPKVEEYGLGSQIRRSGVSIPANIAEGHGRDHTGQYLQHLSFAKGSLMELETHLFLASRLGFVQENDTQLAFSLAAETSRMLSGLIAKLRKRSHEPQRLAPRPSPLTPRP